MLNPLSKISQLHDWWAMRVDSMATSSPRLYFIFVSSLAAAGYAYLLMFPALVVFGLLTIVITTRPDEVSSWLMTDWLLRLLLLSISATGAWVTYKLFTIKPELPKGRILTNDDSRTLLHRIRELTGTYQSSAIHRICLTSRFDIDIVRTPSCGYPARFTNTLHIGLPVMLLLSPLHLKILIARKIGQLSNSMHRTTGRLYYLHNIWSQYKLVFERDWTLHNFLLRIFFSWYAPFFHASTMPARRLDEHVADKRALEIASNSEVAEMIAIFEVKNTYLHEKFWPFLYNMAYTNKQPKFLPYKSMDKLMNHDLDPATAQYYLDRSLTSDEDPLSSLPLIADRLSVLGIDKIRIPAPKKENAGNHFFGRNLPVFQKQYDSLWYKINKRSWQKRFMLGKKEQRRLESLRYQANQSLLSSDEIRVYLDLITKYVSTQQSTALYMSLLDSDNLDPGILFELGRLLIDSNHKEGVDALVSAMALRDDLTVDCCQLIIKFMVQNGHMKEAQDYRRKILAHQVENE